MSEDEIKREFSETIDDIFADKEISEESKQRLAGIAFTAAKYKRWLRERG